MLVKTFNELTNKELYEILKLRQEVFVLEQHCLYQDIDGIDLNAIHVFEKDKEEIISYLRIYINTNQEIQIGRVLTKRRNQGYGLEVLKKGIEVALKEYPNSELIVEAQVYAIPFYEKAGFEVCSEEFLEDGIPHVKMKYHFN